MEEKTDVRTVIFKLRMNSDERNMLDELSRMTKISRSELVRSYIYMAYKSMKASNNRYIKQ